MSSCRACLVPTYIATNMSNTRISGAGVHTIHGRTFLTKSQFPLPIDSQERRRWDIMHEILKRSVGGLYMNPELVRAALESKEGRVPRILDVGTGSGTWAIEMAKEFPQCEVIGIDITAPAPRSSCPPNVVFQVADANLPLSFETGSIDIVHARMIEPGIKDYPKWLSEVSRVLRPNRLSVYVVCTGHPASYDENRKELPTVPLGEDGYTGFQNLLAASADVIYTRRGSPITRDHWTRWMEENGNFDRIGRNEDIQQPIGPWQEGMDEDARIRSELMKDDALIALETMKAMIIDHGYKEELIDRWIEDARSQILGLQVKAFARWSTAWCTRSAEPWKAPEVTGSV